MSYECYRFILRMLLLLFGIKGARARFRGGGTKQITHGMQAIEGPHATVGSTLEDDYRINEMDDDEEKRGYPAWKRGRYSKSMEQKLIADLLKDYNPEGRPVTEASLPVNVSMKFFLMQINELDEKSQILSTTGWLEMEWTDQLLRWGPSNYSNITNVVLAAKSVWLPDVALDNTATKVYDLAHRSDFRVLVSNAGKIWWPPGGRFATSCQVDVSYYPFDDQICELKFTNWVYQLNHVALSNSNRSVDLEYYHPNGEWNVINTMAMTVAEKFSCCPDPFIKVKFVLHLQRRSTFYMMNVLLPFLMISFLILMVFCLPPEAGEKVSLGTTLLLSFSVFQLLIADNMPQTSAYIPIVSIYLTIFMAMTTLSIILSVMILRIHHHGESIPAPYWLRVAVLGGLGKLILRSDYKLYRRTQQGLDTETFGYQMSVRNKTIPYYAANGAPGAAGSARQCNLASPDNISLLDAIDSDITEISEIRVLNTLKQKSMLQPSEEGEVSVNKLNRSERRRKTDAGESTTSNKSNKQKTLEYEWRLIAKVLDRFFFITFLLMMTISTAVICYKVFNR